MGDLLARARVLTTGDQSQDVATAVVSPRGGITPAAKSGSISNVICHRCNSKGHIAKDFWKRGTCFQCGEMGHWAWDCSGNETGDKASASSFSSIKMWMRRFQQRASTLMGKMLSTNWHWLLANNHWCRLMPVLEQSNCERDDNWRHVSSVLWWRNGNCVHRGRQFC